MPKSRPGAKRRRATGSATRLHFHDKDTAFTVTRKTMARLVRTLGLTEIQVVHVALAKFASQALPRYEPDDGPLTDEQLDAIRRMHPPGRMKVTQSLF